VCRHFEQVHFTSLTQRPLRCFQVGNAALSAAEKSALLDEMLGTNAATRALLMPEQSGDTSRHRATQARIGH